MKINVTKLLFLSLFLSSACIAEYQVLNQDYLLGSHQVKISFSPSLMKEEFSIEYQPCPNCSWLKAQSYNDTELFYKTLPVDFKTFKKKVKSYKYNPPNHKYRAYISLDTRNNNIFTIKWDHVEL